jgi:D-glycero-D-manno-heptose 1,7-bisphosphate phosphatase
MNAALGPERHQIASGPLDMVLSLPLLFVSEPDSTPDRCITFNYYHKGMTDSGNNALPSSLRTIFLDRNGVLNEKMPEGRFAASWSDFHLLPGVAEAIGRLNRAGLRVVLVSNQRGIALGLYTAADVNAIHSAFQNLLGCHGAHVDGFYFCPHDKRQCNCRKPLPGLFEQAVADFPAITAATSAMIGDSLSDIEFGRRLGMTTVFIDSNRERQKPGAEAATELADLRFSSLVEAVDHMLEKLGPGKPA